MRRGTILLSLLLLAGSLLVGCGGKDETTEKPPPTTKEARPDNPDTRKVERGPANTGTKDVD